MNTAALFQEADLAMYRAKRNLAGTTVGPCARPRADRDSHHDDLARRRA
jgi:hypothetical protein